MKKYLNVFIFFLILTYIQIPTSAKDSFYTMVYELNGKHINKVVVTVSDFVWKDGNEHTILTENGEKGPIEIETIISDNAKEYEQVIIMDFKSDDTDNPYPEIESMNVAVECPQPSGGWSPLGKDYRLMYLLEDTVEDLSTNITDYDFDEVKFTVDKLGKYVIYFDPRVYDLIFYDGEPIPTEEGNIMPEIYYEIEGLGRKDVVEFPPIPEKEGYVFTGWKAWSGSGIYYINTQPIYANQYSEYYASWCPEDEYESINIEISSDEAITKGKENGKKIILKTNYGVFVKDDEFPTEWRTAYDLETDEQIKADILFDWKSKWNVVGSDDIIIESATRIDDKTVEFVLSGNSNDKYSNADIYIEFDNALLMPEPYEVDGEIIDWNDTKIKMDSDGARAKMYRSDNAVTLSKQNRTSTGGGITRYTVLFETNGGGEVESQNLKWGSVVQMPENPVREGFKFAGWYADEELTQGYDFNTRVTKGMTLYAAWEEDDSHKIILTVGKKEAIVFGKTVENDVAPVIENDRVMLPVRFVAESLGAEVIWEKENPDRVKITKDETEIVILIGEDYATVNGERVQLDSPAFAQNYRTYLPVRFVAENLGCKVHWNEATKQVVITK